MKLPFATYSYAQNCDEISCSKDTQSDDDYLECNKKKQACLEGKIKETQTQATSLKGTINILNGQINLQQLQVDQTYTEVSQLEKEIVVLEERISGLSLSLDKLSNLLIERIRSSYKLQRSNPHLSLLLNKSFSQALKDYKYLKQAEKQTAKAMLMAENQRLAYDEQKKLKEEKQLELEKKQILLEQQKQQLEKQKKDQQYLLNETQLTEAKYQTELATTLSELAAIQSIIAGKGTENKVRDVSQGEKIASIIPGASACSTGTHLHFEIVKNGAHTNPANYLKSVDITWLNQPDDPFSFNGSWEWPINNPAKITQGYGMTYYARVKRYYGGAPHSGIDILSKSTDYTVKAVKDGELYRGSIKCGGGYLRYVKIDHKDSDIDTFYLHVNY